MAGAQVDRPRPRDKRVTIIRTIQDGQLVEDQAKNEKSLRPVALTTGALEALDALAEPLRRDQFIFQPAHGEHIDLAAFRRSPWGKALDVACLGYSEPYGMQDTFAALALNAGIDLAWIAKQMGNSAPSLRRTTPAMSAAATSATSTGSTTSSQKQPDTKRTHARSRNDGNSIGAPGFEPGTSSPPD